MNNEKDKLGSIVKIDTTDTSYLEIIIGPMFSGKTSKLFEIYKQCIFCNIPVLVINHSYDVRYHDTMMSTHDKKMIPCIQTSKLTSLLNINSNMILSLMKTSIILINEAQFFEDLYDFVSLMLRENKKIYISGLDGDFERKKFGQILDLIPLCDKVTKLTSLCSICKNGTHGIFSLRLSGEKVQTLVGSDNYISVCRKCYETNYK
jgi:thymidine kinase